MNAPRRFLIVGDNHGDCVDPVTAQALWAFMGDWKPEIRVHLGDNWDLRNLRKGASDEEKADSLENDWEAGTEFLTRFFKGGKENHFLRGNHDERIYDFTRNATGVLRDYARDGVKRMERIVAQCKATMLPYDSALGILELGKLSVLHGYHTGIGACRQHANIYGNCIFGHVHTSESAPVPSLKSASAESIGCLCIRDMEYINKKTGKLRWAQGWVYGVLMSDGSYQMFKTRKVNGHFYAAESVKEY